MFGYIKIKPVWPLNRCLLKELKGQCQLKKKKKSKSIKEKEKLKKKQ